MRLVKYADGRVCEAWQGDFDEWDNPMKDGVLYLPGVRLCGHRDCVSVDHVQGAVAKPHRKRGRPAKLVDPDIEIVAQIIRRRRES